MCCENTMKAALHARGLRLTAQRQMVLWALHQVSDDVSAEELYQLVNQKAQTLDLSTVYRSLELFEQINLVSSSLSSTNERRYELLTVRAPHFHIKCQECGETFSVDLGELEQLAARLQQTHQFTAEMEHLMIPGICVKCRGQAVPETTTLTQTFAQGAQAHG